jgi:glutathionylspermidine synthase
VFKAAVFQWGCLEDAVAQQIVPADADQFNSLHERLIAGWKALLSRPTASSPEIPSKVHFAGMLDNPEDAGTLAYLADTATQAGAATRLVAMDTIGLTPKGQFVDPNEAPIEIAFKLYPWEWMFREEFGGFLKGASTRWIEPPWKAILSSKGILPLLWEMFPGHPNLLPPISRTIPTVLRSAIPMW